MELFFEKGYEKTTIQDILEQTQLSKGALYHHFKSKQDILEQLTKREQETILALFQQLADDSTLTTTEKIGKMIDYFAGNSSLTNLSKQKWAEKIPFALLHSLRNTLNVLSPQLEVILVEGNKNDEIACKYPKQIAEILLLLFDIWLDPLIVNGSYKEICQKIDFIVLFLNKFDTPLITNEKQKQLKESLRNYYED